MRLDGRELAAIFVGGFIGATARAELGTLTDTRAGHWPWATFIANVGGALLLGYVATRLQDRSPLRSLLGVGICGALTTFSTMQLELLQLLDAGHVALALTYASASIAAGFAAVALATRRVRRT